MQTHVSAPATEAGDASPTQRDWWTATKETWANPAEWSVWQMGILLGLVAILAAAAFWVTRPGGLLGGAEPLNATAAYTNEADGRYIYRLLEPRAGRSRMLTTLQSIYNAHKAAAAGQPMTVILLRRTAPVAPYVTGAGNANGDDILARITVQPGQNQREAVLRANEGAPLQPVTLDW